MVEHILRRDGDAPLKFTGAVIRQAGEREFAHRDRLRWHRIDLYRIMPGEGYVVRVAFHTRWKGESDRVAVEVCATPADVRKFLRDYDPAPASIGYPAGKSYEDQQRRLVATLTEQYRQCVSEVLDHDDFAVAAEIVPEQSCDDYARLDVEAASVFVTAELLGLPLSEAEACAICDANNGAMLLPDYPASGVAANVADGDRLNGLGEKWSVDAQALAARIFAATPVQQFALSWACAQFWRRTHLPTSEALRKSGFTIREEVAP